MIVRVLPVYYTHTRLRLILIVQATIVVRPQWPKTALMAKCVPCRTATQHRSIVPDIDLLVGQQMLVHQLDRSTLHLHRQQQFMQYGLHAPAVHTKMHLQPQRPFVRHVRRVIQTHKILRQHQ